MKIDKIYCINLKSRKDRKEKMLFQFEKLKLNVQWIKGEKIYFTLRKNKHKKYNFSLKGQLGCLKSHLKIINDAIKNNYENIIIFEDDVIICDDFVERLNNIEKYIPKDWDVIHLAGNCYHHYEKHQPYSEKINKYIMKNNQVYGTFALLINKKIFKILKNLYKKKKYNTDNIHVEEIQKNYNSYSVLPFMCHITNDKSDITKVYDAEIYERIKKDYKNNFKIKC